MSKTLRLAISFAISVLIIYFFWRAARLENFAGFSFKIIWRWVWPAFVFYFLNIFLKALRFHFFFDQRFRLKNLWSIVSIHGFLNNILPFRSGELSYLYLIKKSGQATDGENLSSLALARFFDFLTVLFFLAFAAVFLLRFPGQSFGAGRALLAVLAMGLGGGILVLFLVFNEALAQIMGRAALRFAESGLKFWERFFLKMKEIVEAVGKIKKPRRLFGFLLISIFIWLADCFFEWAALSAANLRLNLGEAVFITAFPVLAALLPLSTPAGLGTFEGVVGAGLLILGFSLSPAFGASIILHLETLAFSFLLFGAGAFYRIYARKVRPVVF